MENKRNTSFIVELLVLFIILLCVIVTIILLAVKTRDQEIKAAQLTEAVACAENTAELTAGAKDTRSAYDMMKRMDGTQEIKIVKDEVVSHLFVKNSKGTGSQYIVKVHVDGEKASPGRYIKKKINIYSNDDGRLVYNIDTGNYLRGSEI